MGWRGLAGLAVPSRRLLSVLCTAQPSPNPETRPECRFPGPQASGVTPLPVPAFGGECFSTPVAKAAQGLPASNFKIFRQSTSHPQNAVGYPHWGLLFHWRVHTSVHRGPAWARRQGRGQPGRVGRGQARRVSTAGVRLGASARRQRPGLARQHVGSGQVWRVSTGVIVS